MGGSVTHPECPMLVDHLTKGTDHLEKSLLLVFGPQHIEPCIGAAEAMPSPSKFYLNFSIERHKAATKNSHEHGTCALSNPVNRMLIVALLYPHVSTMKIQPVLRKTPVSSCVTYHGIYVPGQSSTLTCHPQHQSTHDERALPHSHTACQYTRLLTGRG